MLAKVAGKVIKFVLEQQPSTKSYQLAWELSNLRRGPAKDGSVFSLIHILQFTEARVIYWSRQHFTGLADLLRVSLSGFNIQARYLNQQKPPAILVSFQMEEFCRKKSVSDKPSEPMAGGLCVKISSELISDPRVLNATIKPRVDLTNRLLITQTETVIRPFVIMY